jgi:hypothetical protein
VSIPRITGRFLAHNRLDQIDRDFLGADLHAGKLLLIEPTLGQCSMLVRANRIAVSWAFKRLGERAEIQAGYIPLVPPKITEQDRRQNAQAFIDAIPEADLINFVRSVGVGRILDAAVKAEGTI